MSRGGRIGLALWVAVCLSAPALAQSIPSSYGKGSKQVKTLLERKQRGQAVEKSEWEEAIVLLQAAIRDNPNQMVLRDGTTPVPYEPYYFLGIAQAEAGKSSEALASLEVAKNFPQIRSDALQVIEGYVRSLGEATLWKTKLADGRRLLDAGDFAGAEAPLREARRLQPGDSEVAAQWDRLERRKSDFQALIDKAGGHVAAAQLESARDAFEEARRIGGTLFGPDPQAALRKVTQDLDRAGREFADGQAAFLAGRYDQAERKYRAAAEIDSEFSRSAEALQALARFKSDFRLALQTLFSRDAGGPLAAIQRLERLEENVDKVAFLGVAHATAAALASSAAARRQHEDRALAQFGRVKQEWASYRLPSNLASPAVQQLFARAG